MRTRNSQFTPREAAYSIAIDWLHAVYNERTADIEDIDDRASVQREVRRQVAALHNRLLRQSGLDGLEIGE